MNDQTAGHADLPRSAYLDNTLRRAWSAAEQRAHRYVTLEHLLLALLDDPDATELLQAADADIPAIQGSLATTLANNSSLRGPGNKAPAFSYKFDNLLSAAFEHAVRMGRKEMDGAFVLLAVAKHPECDAAAILAGNSFNATAAERTLESYLGAQPQREPAGARPSAGAKGGAANAESPRAAAQAARPEAAAQGRPAAARTATQQGATADRFMEDMLASVRTILETDSAKEWALAPLLNPAALAQPPKGGRPPQPPIQNAEPRPTLQNAEPRSGGPALALNPAAMRAPERAAPPPPPPAREPAVQARPAVAPQAAPRIQSPAPVPTPPPPPAARPAPAHAPALAPAGFAEPPAPKFDLERQAPPPPPPPPPQLPPQARQQAQEAPLVLEKVQQAPSPQRAPEPKRKRAAPKAPRPQADTGAALAKKLEAFPRTAQLSRGQAIEMNLSKEEVAQLFAPQPQAVLRAVTVKLSAPEGGLYIETLAAETQWIAQRPGAAPEEPFGAWVWGVMPGETGTWPLALTVAVRDVDANGAVCGAQQAEQAFKIRVRKSFARVLGGMIRALLLLGLGGGLAAGALYALKMMGKLPI